MASSPMSPEDELAILMEDRDWLLDNIDDCGPSTLSIQAVDELSLAIFRTTDFLHQGVKTK